MLFSYQILSIMEFCQRSYSEDQEMTSRKKGIRQCLMLIWDLV